MFVMIDKVEGIMSAPPMPMLARAAMSMPTDPENAAHAEPAAQAASPTEKVRLRPHPVGQAARHQQQACRTP